MVDVAELLRMTADAMDSVKMPSGERGGLEPPTPRFKSHVLTASGFREPLRRPVRAKLRSVPADQHAKSFGIGSAVIAFLKRKSVQQITPATSEGLKV